MEIHREESMKLRVLIGSGDKIMLLALPFIVAGVALNVLFPSYFAVGSLSAALRVIMLALLAAGVAIWFWSVALVIIKVPQKKLITTGPFALVKHPIYTAVSLLVAPAAGILTNTWLGIALGAVIYFGSRLYAPAEERILANIFGIQWQEYAKRVKIRWI